MAELLSLKPWRTSIAPGPGTALTTAVLGVMVVTALYFGREVLVPIALAVLMSFVLAPLVRLLQGLYVPRVLAVIVSVLVAFAAVFSLGALMVAQVNQLAGDLPGYQSTLREKIQSLRGATGGTSTLERASEVLKSLNKELDKPNINPSPLAGDRPEPNRPIPVEVRQPDPGASNRRCLDHTFDPTAHDDRAGYHICDLHSHSKTRFAEQACSSRRRARSAAHDRRN